MINSSLVSIIIPTYNRASLIGETLDSVLAQTYTNWECIVVDDGSSDNTDEVVGEYVARDNRFQYHKRPDTHKPGGNGARNYGFKLSKGKYINWFDSDDLITPDHIMLLLNGLLKKDIDATVSSGLVFEKKKENIIGSWSKKNLVKENLVDEMVACLIMWQTGTVLWDRNSLEKKPFIEELHCSQEWTFHLTQILKGIRYEYIAKPTCLIRNHKNRIGKLDTKNKYLSVYLSREIIFYLLLKHSKLNEKNSKYILAEMSSTLKRSIKSKYYSVTLVTLKFLFKNSHHFKNQKLSIIKIIFVACPIYAITGKGEVLFKIK